MKRPMKNKGWRFSARNIKHLCNDSFIGYYKKNCVEVTRETPPDGDKNPHLQFYITVTAPDGCYLYEGYYGTAQNTIREAITEALTGAHLIPREAAA